MQTQIRIHFRASESSLPYWCLNLNSLLVNSKMTILHLVRYCHFGVSPVNYSDSDQALPHSQPLVKNCHFWYITSTIQTQINKNKCDIVILAIHLHTCLQDFFSFHSFYRINEWVENAETYHYLCMFFFHKMQIAFSISRFVLVGGPSRIFLNRKYSHTRDLTLPGYGKSSSSWSFAICIFSAILVQYRITTL